MEPEMTKLSEELDRVQQEIKRLQERERDIYRKSLEAPPEEKVCGDFFAKMLSEDDERGGMKFPITVSAIHWAEDVGLDRKMSPCLVAVRPATEEKTYVGILVGDLPLGVSVSWHRESGVMSLGLSASNPAIVVPALGKVVMGCESWWRRVKNAEELKEITDTDVDGVWYVQLLRGLTEKEDK